MPVGDEFLDAANSSRLFSSLHDHLEVRSGQVTDLRLETRLRVQANANMRPSQNFLRRLGGKI